MPDNESQPAWLPRLVHRLEEIGQLEDNWDSYGAPKISPRLIKSALNTLLSVVNPRCPMPHVVPTPSGGLQFEWEQPDYSVELEFSPKD